jgi:hypothetical protein
MCVLVRLRWPTRRSCEQTVRFLRGQSQILGAIKKQLIVLGAGAVGAMTLSTMLLGTGVATAAEYDGQTCADAAAAIEESGGTPIVATRIGSELPEDDCIVVNSQNHSYLRDPLDDVYVLSVTNEVRLNLNCAGGYATATNPGASVVSPAGREAKAAAEEAAAAEEQEPAAVSTPGE